MLRGGVVSVFVLATVGLAMLTIPAPSSEAATPTISLGMPGTVQVGQTFTVSLQLTGATEVAAFEAEVDFDFNFVSFVPDSTQLGPFLGSTGRTPFCVTPIVTETYVHVGCTTLGTDPPAPSGDGVLETLQFTATRSGVARFFLPAPPCELATVLGVNILPINCVGATLNIVASTPIATATSTRTALSTPTFTPTPILNATPTPQAGATQTGQASATETPPAEGSLIPGASTPSAATSTPVNVTLGGQRPRGSRPSALPDTGTSRPESTRGAPLFEVSLLLLATLASFGFVAILRRRHGGTH